MQAGYYIFCTGQVPMKEGKIVEMASPSEIYKNPSKDYTKRLIDSIPKGISKEASL